MLGYLKLTITRMYPLLLATYLSHLSHCQLQLSIKLGYFKLTISTICPLLLAIYLIYPLAYFNYPLGNFKGAGLHPTTSVFDEWGIRLKNHVFLQIAFKITISTMYPLLLANYFSHLFGRSRICLANYPISTII